MSIYLDYNASAPVLPEVLETMIDVYRNTPGNADSRTHIYGTNAKKMVNDSRASIASVLGVDPSEIIFTSGSTESNNTVILGIRDFAEKTGRNHIVTTAIEHKAILEALKAQDAEEAERLMNEHVENSYKTRVKIREERK